MGHLWSTPEVRQRVDWPGLLYALVLLCLPILAVDLGGETTVDVSLLAAVRRSGADIS